MVFLGNAGSLMLGIANDPYALNRWWSWYPGMVRQLERNLPELLHFVRDSGHSWRTLRYELVRELFLRITYARGIRRQIDNALKAGATEQEMIQVFKISVAQGALTMNFENLGVPNFAEEFDRQKGQQACHAAGRCKE